MAKQNPRIDFFDKQDEYWECFSIPMTKGYFTIIDIDDFELVIDYNWHPSGSKDDDKYAHTWSYKSGIRKTLALHRLLMNPPSHLHVDHINCNKMDNRRKNLRFCTPHQNTFNQPGRKNTSSKYKGVAWRSERNHWKVCIELKGKPIYIGSSRCEKEAASMYNKKAIELFGEFAWLNKIE